MTITTSTRRWVRCATPFDSACGHCRHARRRLWPPLEQPGHACAAAETASCRLGRRRSRRRARPQLRRGGRADCQAADRRGVAKDQQNRSLIFTIGPQLGPNRRQPNYPVGCELFKEVRQTSFLRALHSSGQNLKLPSARSLGHGATRSTRNTQENPDFHL